MADHRTAAAKKTTRSKSTDRKSTARSSSSERKVTRTNKSTSSTTTTKKSKSPQRSASKSPSRQKKAAAAAKDTSSKGAKVFTKKELADQKSRNRSRSTSKSKSPPKREKTPAKRTLRSASTASTSAAANTSSSSTASNASNRRPSNQGPVVSTMDRLKHEIDEIAHADIFFKNASKKSPPRRSSRVDEIDLTDLDLDKRYGLRKRAALLASTAPSSSTPYTRGRSSSNVTITKRSLGACKNLSASFCQKLHGCASNTIGRLCPAKCRLSCLCPVTWFNCGYMRFNKCHVCKFLGATILLVLVLVLLNYLNLIGFDVCKCLTATKDQIVSCASKTVSYVSSSCCACTTKMKEAVLSVSNKIVEIWHNAFTKTAAATT